MSEASNRKGRLLTIAEMGALRSECPRWMAENHDAFAAMPKTYRPKWEVLAVTLVQDKLLPEPAGYWSDDPAIRGPARKQAGRAAKRVWDRVHARMKARVDASGAAVPAPLPDTALERVVNSTTDLHKTFEDAGVGLVACYVLTPRVDDLNIIKTMEAAGFQPSATVMGRADPSAPPEEAFAAVTRHSIFRQVVARGAAAVWMPALESDVMQEIEVKRLDFGMARDGQVPAGAAFYPIGGLRRSSVGRWLARMEQAFSPVSGWLP